MGAQRAPGLGTRREGEGASGARSQRNHERAQSVMLIGGVRAIRITARLYCTIRRRAAAELRRRCFPQWSSTRIFPEGGRVRTSGLRGRAFKTADRRRAGARGAGARNGRAYDGRTHAQRFASLTWTLLCTGFHGVVTWSPSRSEGAPAILASPPLCLPSGPAVFVRMASV